MKFRIKHTTHYKYGSPVSLCFNEARMSPLNNTHQTCARNRFVIHPQPDSVHKRFDYYGNQVTSFDILQPHRELTVSVYSDVQVLDPSRQFLFSADCPWEYVRDSLKTTTLPELLPVREFLLPSPLVPLLTEARAYAEKTFTPQRSLLECCNELMARLHTDFVYDPTATSISTPLATVIAQKRGVCQDFAHLGIACLRSMGIAASYVSGYLETTPPPGQPKLAGADASHAWYAVHMLDDGWVGFDPTNNLMPNEQYITVALGRDFADVTPLKGVIYGGDQTLLAVSVDVDRIEV